MFTYEITVEWKVKALLGLSNFLLSSAHRHRTNFPRIPAGVILPLSHPPPQKKEQASDTVRNRNNGGRWKPKLLSAAVGHDIICKAHGVPAPSPATALHFV